MAPSDIYARLQLALPNLQVEKYKTIKDSDKSLLVTTTNGREMIFTYLSPGVWDICSIKYHRKKGAK